MPPKKNVAAPNAVKLFNCGICDKGYSRQTDFENHLRSYDHNHRQRLADMKKITAANDTDKTRKRGLDGEMRSIPTSGPGLGRGFRRIGGESAGTGGVGFKKVGVTTSAPSGFRRVGVEVGGTSSGKETSSDSAPSAPAPTPAEPISKQQSPAKVDEPTSEAGMIRTETDKDADMDVQKDLGAEAARNEVNNGADVVMGENDEDDIISWDEYDFRKPTGCNHTNCPGCKMGGLADERMAVVSAM